MLWDCAISWVHYTIAQQERPRIGIRQPTRSDVGQWLRVGRFKQPALRPQHDQCIQLSYCGIWMHWADGAEMVGAVGTIDRSRRCGSPMIPHATGTTPVTARWTLPIGQCPNMEAILASATIWARPDVLAGAAADQTHVLDRCINGQACTHRTAYSTLIACSTPTTVHLSMLGYDLLRCIVSTPAKRMTVCPYKWGHFLRHVQAA
jgi:hypothetical protein